MKKVTVVGRGTAGALGALHFYRHLDKNEYEIDWVFDDSRPAQSVGEGSTLLLPRGLYECAGLTVSGLPAIGGNIKTGILKSGWGKGKEFYHDFFSAGIGYHFQATMLHQYSLDFLQGKININNDTFISDIDEVDSDFIFDCSGTPKELGDDFVKAEHITVNTAKVWQCPWDKPEFNYTLTLARPYGWVFGIPLSNRLSIGYIYNRDFATLEMVEEDIKEVFEKYNIEPGEDGNYIEFNSYQRKENFTGRVGRSGNASFFLEPLEATSTTVMDKCQRHMYDIITGSVSSTDEGNKSYKSLLSRTEDMIMLHYSAGSQWDTDFWRYAKESGERRIRENIKDPEFKKALEEALRMADANDYRLRIQDVEYGVWGHASFGIHLRNLDISEKIRKLIK